MTHPALKWLACGLLFAAALGCTDRAGEPPVIGSLDGLMRLHPERVSGLSNGGWNQDRRRDLKPLSAGARITVADIPGPAVITLIHTTRHASGVEEVDGEEIPVAGVFARGIVLEIWFEGAETPAVEVPLADFFGDGCNGRSTDFSTPLIECVPWSYNAYFPMPFRERARVILRNDTDQDALNYSYVEWESLPEWNPDLGYFHATYQRQVFRLTKDTNQTLFAVKGSGHLVGRQISISTDEPTFADFEFIMEGNNEVDIDGRERALDYLGAEDSFGFSWGFREAFVGFRAGMPVVVRGGGSEGPTYLSLFRFHDHMPIRFTRDLRWRINWSNERQIFAISRWRKAHAEALARDGCWIDFASVHYWYQNVPGGFDHTPLRPVSERTRDLLRSNL